ncbi:MAG: sigma-70 family RNA polymerase sigma factor, partial [Planctomycetota bacterium]
MTDAATSTREALIAEAKAGEGVALGRLLGGYESYLLLLARAKLGARLQGKADAADIVQATFLDAHRQFPNFAGTVEAELTAWLRTILAGQLALVMRRYLGTAARDVRLERQIQQDLTDASRALDHELVAPGTTPSGRASRREQAVLLADALAKLQDDYREVIVLRHVEGLTMAQVAERMGRSGDSVQKLWVRALGKLRLVMGG